MAFARSRSSRAVARFISPMSYFRTTICEGFIGDFPTHFDLADADRQRLPALNLGHMTLRTSLKGLELNRLRLRFSATFQLQ